MKLPPGRPPPSGLQSLMPAAWALAGAGSWLRRGASPWPGAAGWRLSVACRAALRIRRGRDVTALSSGSRGAVARCGTWDCRSAPGLPD